jgi:hypothetical protein
MNDLKMLRAVLGFAIVLLFLPEESLLRRLQNAPAHYYGELWFVAEAHQLILARNSSTTSVQLDLPAESVQIGRADGSPMPSVANAPGEMRAGNTSIIEVSTPVARHAWSVSQEGARRFVPSTLQVVTRAEVDRVIGLTACLILLAVLLALSLARYAMERNVSLSDEAE